MAYEFMYNVALDIVNKRTEAGEYISPDDTVCVIYSNTGRLYTGLSRMEQNAGQLNLVHAEIEAIRNMQGFGDSGIESLLLLHASSRSFMFPCNSCMNYILSLNPANSQCWVWGPDRLMRISELGFGQGNNSVQFNPAPQFNSRSSSHYSTSSVSIRNTGVMGRQVRADDPQEQSMNYDSFGGSDMFASPNTDNAKSDYLKKRVRNIMKVADDDEEDEEVFEEKKGLFGGIFGKK